MVIGVDDVDGFAGTDVVSLTVAGCSTLVDATRSLGLLASPPSAIRTPFSPVCAFCHSRGGSGDPESLILNYDLSKEHPRRWRVDGLRRG